MSDQGIQVPAGTIVNGVPFVKYQELQKRIAELEMETASFLQFKEMMTRPILTPREKMELQPEPPSVTG
jgi:hypothetical protein